MRSTHWLCVAALCVCAQAAKAAGLLSVVPLPYDLQAWEPVLDTQTQFFHHDIHYVTYINNTNRLLAANASLAKQSLTQLVQSLGKTAYPIDTERTLRNQGGGSWNHALFWKILAPANSSVANVNAISPGLLAAIRSSFGTVEGLIANVTDLGTRQFGSGWAWVVTNSSGKLFVTNTPNQDNPLMSLPTVTTKGVPILGLDVWEHAYYLKHGPKRGEWIKAFWTIVNWRKVSDNYATARTSSPDYASIAQ